MALNQAYYKLWFESFELSNSSGHRDKIGLRLRKRQKLPTEVVAECENKKLDLFELLTSCSRSYFYDYPVGTKFLINAKLNNKEGRGTFFYSPPTWKPFEIVETKSSSSRGTKRERRMKKASPQKDTKISQTRFNDMLIKAVSDKDVAHAIAAAIVPMIDIEHEFDKELDQNLNKISKEIDRLKKTLRSV